MNAPKLSDLPKALYSCSVDYCRECSYPADMLHWHAVDGVWLCDYCWDNLPLDENEDDQKKGISMADFIKEIEDSK